MGAGCWMDCRERAGRSVRGAKSWKRSELSSPDVIPSEARDLLWPVVAETQIPRRFAPRDDRKERSWNDNHTNSHAFHSPIKNRLHRPQLSRARKGARK